MNLAFYPYIFKRKSFHLFRNSGDFIIDDAEINEIYLEFQNFQPLINDIKTAIRIVPSSETTCNRGQEYCILLYSEKKEHYLQNIGYLGEQLDLYLASKNIGALWFGIGKTDAKSYNGLDFVIMIAIRKVPEDKFRKDMYRSKRKDLSEVWQGEPIDPVSNIVRFAPSACNSQPWLVERKDDTLSVYRTFGRRGIMPKDMITYYNRIDMGIFLYFLELCFLHNGFEFTRTLSTDNGEANEKMLYAEYRFKGGQNADIF